MNWKKFFRPEPIKIIIAILIVAVLAASPLIKSIMMPLYALPSLCLYLLIAIYLYGADVAVVFYPSLAVLTITLILIIFLYWYLPACIIVFIFKVLNKRCLRNALKYRSDPKIQLAYGTASFVLTFLIIYSLTDQADWLVALIVGISNFIVAGFYTQK